MGNQNNKNNCKVGNGNKAAKLCGGGGGNNNPNEVMTQVMSAVKKVGLEDDDDEEDELRQFEGGKKEVRDLFALCN